MTLEEFECRPVIDLHHRTCYVSYSRHVLRAQELVSRTCVKECPQAYELTCGARERVKSDFLRTVTAHARILQPKVTLAAFCKEPISFAVERTIDPKRSVISRQRRQVPSPSSHTSSVRLILSNASMAEERLRESLAAGLNCAKSSQADSIICTERESRECCH